MNRNRKTKHIGQLLLDTMRFVYHLTKFIDALTVVNITIDKHKMELK